MNIWKTMAVTSGVLALAAPAANAKFDVSSPSKALHGKVTHHNRAAAKHKTKWTKPGSVIGSSCGATWSYCDRTASASANDAVQPGSASTASSTEEQLCALFGMNCDAEYLSSVNDASPPSAVSPPNPPSATYNDGAGT
jgi:hypothetical protein